MLPRHEVTFIKPEGNLLLGIFDGIRTVADIATNINSIVAADGAGGRGKGISGTEDSSASLDGIASLPDHGADGTA